MEFGSEVHTLTLRGVYTKNIFNFNLHCNKTQSVVPHNQLLSHTLHNNCIPHSLWKYSYRIHCIKKVNVDLPNSLSFIVGDNDWVITTLCQVYQSKLKKSIWIQNNSNTISIIVGGNLWAITTNMVITIDARLPLPYTTHHSHRTARVVIMVGYISSGDAWIKSCDPSLRMHLLWQTYSK